MVLTVFLTFYNDTELEVFMDSQCEASLRVSISCTVGIQKKGLGVIGCIRYIKVLTDVIANYM